MVVNLLMQGRKSVECEGERWDGCESRNFNLTMNEGRKLEVSHNSRNEVCPPEIESRAAREHLLGRVADIITSFVAPNLLCRGNATTYIKSSWAVPQMKEGVDEEEGASCEKWREEGEWVLN